MKTNPMERLNYGTIIGGCMQGCGYVFVKEIMHARRAIII